MMTFVGGFRQIGKMTILLFYSCIIELFFFIILKMFYWHKFLRLIF